MSILAKAAELVETLAGERLCALMGHHWGISAPAPIGRRTYRPVKLCKCCGLIEDLPTAPPTGHPESMAYDPHSEVATWLRSIEQEVFDGGAS